MNRIEENSKKILQSIPRRKRLFTATFYVAGILFGILFGLFGTESTNTIMNFIATIFTRLFSFIAVQIIALALITTLAKLGKGSESGLIFFKTITYTLLTTIIAAIIGATLFVTFKPANVPAEVSGAANLEQEVVSGSYLDHFISIVPNNILQPFVSGNVLSVLLIAAAIGLALASMPHNEKREAVENLFMGLQDILFKIIHAIIAILPIGIMGFTAKLITELENGLLLSGLVTYFGVVIGSNLLQMFVVLPLIMFIKGLNPLKVARGMLPALLVAFFSKSSAGTLPVTMASAEDNLHVNPKVSRFVLPICTTINMNGCAAFILITSLYLMQNAGIEITPFTIVAWIFIATIAAVGNAGVPMGCYFLTISLLSSMQIPVLLMGVILPVYAIIDMLETGVNVWSDASVCNIVDHDLKDRLEQDNQTLSPAN